MAGRLKTLSVCRLRLIGAERGSEDDAERSVCLLLQYLTQGFQKPLHQPPAFNATARTARGQRWHWASTRGPEAQEARVCPDPAVAPAAGRRQETRRRRPPRAPIATPRPSPSRRQRPGQPPPVLNPAASMSPRAHAVPLPAVSNPKPRGHWPTTADHSML